jgi:F0F1-type ATP synthase membrane subunit c/vacuolar-type H+-ATPase subunit K
MHTLRVSRRPDRCPAGFAAGPPLEASMHQMKHEEDTMTKLFRYGGIAASIALIAFGIGAVVTGFSGRDQVRSSLGREQIVGTPDSTIAGRKVDTGSEAQAFAKVMRKHTLEATGGQTYSQMGQFLDKAGKPTSDDKLAAVDPKTNKPVSNPARQIWVTETALTTALNTAYFAESTAMFAIVMGFALLLVGVGFLVLTLIALRRPSTATEPRWSAARAAPTVG